MTSRRWEQGGGGGDALGQSRKGIERAVRWLWVCGLGVAKTKEKDFYFFPHVRIGGRLALSLSTSGDGGSGGLVLTWSPRPARTNRPRSAKTTDPTTHKNHKICYGGLVKEGGRVGVAGKSREGGGAVHVARLQAGGPQPCLEEPVGERAQLNTGKAKVMKSQRSAHRRSHRRSHRSDRQLIAYRRRLQWHQLR